MMTIAKAEVSQEIPVFFKKFEECSDLSRYCADLKEQGFTHGLNLNLKKHITVGSLDGEYRILCATLFFKGIPPSFEKIQKGLLSVKTPIWERRKFYSKMWSCGRGDFSAILKASHIKDWIAFFEAEAGSVYLIEKFI